MISSKSVVCLPNELLENLIVATTQPSDFQQGGAFWSLNSAFFNLETFQQQKNSVCCKTRAAGLQ